MLPHAVPQLASALHWAVHALKGPHAGMAAQMD
jgi:hypothetical protein